MKVCQQLLCAIVSIGWVVFCCHSASAQPLVAYDRAAQAPTANAAVAPQATNQVASPSREIATAQSVSQPVENGSRLLAPPSRAQITSPAEGNLAQTVRAPAFTLPKIESFTTAGAGLAIVVGLFMVCAWLLRGSGPKPTSPLPGEVVTVLGRVPLAARNFAHLLQVGNKLVLVAITPEGVSPITEITEPMEVQRLLGACHSRHKQSTTAEFQDILQRLAKEPASGFLGNEVAATYSQQR